MSSNSDKDNDESLVNVGLSQLFPCSYLQDQQEQLIVIQDQVEPVLFDRLLALGFRRSGLAIYKPQCPSCNACQPIRVVVNKFSPSKSQKRTLNKNKDLHIKITDKISPEHYLLYEKYISIRHQDGSMYPPSQKQFEQFLGQGWMKPQYIELYLAQTLIAVAVTDFMPNSLSAIYTFFDPNEEKRSLGSLMILMQCQLALCLKKSFVYLGYQIDTNQKMNYKKLYQPYQILTENGWQEQ